MLIMSEEILHKVLSNIRFTNIVEFDDYCCKIISVLPDSPPLKAEWWSGKEVHIIAIDIDGNFFLRHCDGSVRYWNHIKANDIVAFRSIKDFAYSFREDQDI